MRDAFLDVGRELEPTGFGPALDHRLESGLVDRHLAALQPLDLGLIDVDAQHVVARVRETRTRDETHVAGSENRYPHSSFP